MPGSGSWARARPSRSSTAARSPTAPIRWTWPTLRGRAPAGGRCRRGGARGRGHRAAPHAAAHRRVAGSLAMMTAPARSQLQALQPRNATEDAILAAAREVLEEVPFDRLAHGHDRPARVRVPHDGLLLLRQQARARRPPHPAGVRRHARGGGALPGRRGRAAARAAPRADPHHRRGQRQRGRVPARRPALRAGRPPARRVGALHPPLRGRRRPARIRRDQERGIAADDIDPRHQRAGAVRDGRAPRDHGDHPRRRARSRSRFGFCRSCGGGYAGVLAAGAGRRVRGTRRPRARSPR